MIENMLSEAELRRMKRRVPPEKRQRVEMSCDYCKAKRCKCSRSNSAESCRACNEIGRACKTTKPRKQRHFNRPTPIYDETQFLDPSFNLSSPFPPDYPFFVHQQRPSGSATDNFPQVLPLNPNETGPQWTSAISRRPKSMSVEDIYEDAMGMPRYIGPTGTFAFMCRLKQLGAVLNAPENTQTMGTAMHLYDLNGGKSIDLPPRPIADILVELFFSKVHPEWPTFHRSIFQASYEGMWSFIPETEPAWLMALSMVFLLGLEISGKLPTAGISDSEKAAMKHQYLTKVKELLPDVLSGSTLTHVQALVLYCQYLYISGARDGSWNIAGAAIRMAIAIGLHRNGVNAHCSPLERELRKRVWWSLFVFERIECSALGRASAIDDAECNVGVPTEGLLDMSDRIPLGYINVQSELLILLGTICKEQYSLDNFSQQQMDFAVGIFNALELWLENLPAHLKLDGHTPQSHRRATIILHIQYHYIITLLGRRFLEITATKKHLSSTNPAVVLTFAKRCVTSAQIVVSLLQRLFRFNLFNSTTSFDVYFLKSAAMMLALARRADQADLGIDKEEILKSLKNCLFVLTKCGHFSSTMQKFANITTGFAQVLVDTDSAAFDAPHEYEADASSTGFGFL